MSPAGTPFSLSVRSTYEGLFPLLHLRRHKQGISEITAATQTQTAWHSGHGAGRLPAPGRSVPSKPPLHRGPGWPPSPWRPNTRPEQPKMIRLFDPEPKAFPGRTSWVPEKALGEESSPCPATALALRAGVLIQLGPQGGGLLSPCQPDWNVKLTSTLSKYRQRINWWVPRRVVVEGWIGSLALAG